MTYGTTGDQRCILQLSGNRLRTMIGIFRCNPGLTLCGAESRPRRGRVEELGGSTGVVVSPELKGVCKLMARKRKVYTMSFPVHG